MLNDRPLLIASENQETSRLAMSLDAEFVSLPDLTRPETFEAWRAKTLKGDVRERVIVSVWRSAHCRMACADGTAEFRYLSVCLPAGLHSCGR